MKGIIALDIDGTITADHQKLDSDVCAFLSFLAHDGWILSFISGRTFSWGHKLLQQLQFPYYFAVYNGATIFEMPTRRLLTKKKVSIESLPSVDLILSLYNNDYIIYTEDGCYPRCYFRPENFTKEMLLYLEERFCCFGENLTPLHSHEKLPITEFLSLKYFGSKAETKALARELELVGFHAPVIKDPFNNSYHLIQATAGDVNKGYALKSLKELIPNFNGIVIAAGDDYNDISMLLEADIRIAMETAPRELIAIADLVAPSAVENGIIAGLKSALRLPKTMRKVDDR